MESSKVQARSLQKEIEQRVFAKYAHHEERTRWHVDDPRELDRTQKWMRARSKHRLKKPSCIRDSLENRLQEHPFAYQIGPKSSPRRSGAPLERSSGSRSAPGTRSGRSRDAPGTFPACSGVLPGRSRDAFGVSWGIFRLPQKHIFAKFIRISMATRFWVRFSAILCVFSMFARIVFSVFPFVFLVSFR